MAAATNASANGGRGNLSKATNKARPPSDDGGDGGSFWALNDDQGGTFPGRKIKLWLMEPCVVAEKNPSMNCGKTPDQHGRLEDADH